MLLAAWWAALLVGDAAEDSVAKIAAEHQAAVKALDAERRRNPKATPAKIATLTKRAQSGYFADRMLKAAKQAPKTAAAFDALSWILKGEGGQGLPAAQAEAADLLVTDHLAGPKLPQLCADLSASRSAAVETLLRGALAKAPSREARGKACIALGGYLQCMAQWSEYCQFSDRAQRKMLESTPEGRALLQWTADTDARDLRAEARTLAERAAKEFSDLRPPVSPAKGAPPPGVGGPPIGKPAPEIVGDDLDGKPMKLSEFRGKVVVIEFWCWWCVYCRALAPQDEELISRMRGRPFALLGVNSDGDIAAAKKSAREAGLSWPSLPSWRNGRAIATRWGVVRWPTTCVLDHRGVVRHVGVSGRELEDAVDALMKEVPPAKSP